MRTNILAAAALLALAVSQQAPAQQTQGRDDQPSAAARQTTSTTWSGSGSAPEQAGDLYQPKTRNDGGFGGGSTTDTQGATLPGALNPGADSLENAGQPQPKE